MQMDMNMQDRWPEDTVYLFGRLSFAPYDLEDKALTQQAMFHYFPYDDVAEFETSLYDYQQNGYFKVNTIENEKSKKYIISNVDRKRFKDELSGYINSIEIPIGDMDNFWNVVTQHYKDGHEFSFTISWKDIYGDSSRFNYHPMFWEYFFKLALDELIELKSFAYDRTVAKTFKNDELVDIPKEMMVFYTRPFAKFDVLDKQAQQEIARSNHNLKYKVGIILTPNRHLQLHLDKRYPIWHYKSKSSNTYRLAKALYDDSDTALSRDELNLKTDTKTTLKKLVSNARFNGALNMFIEYGVNEQKRPTVKLTKSISVDRSHYDQLLKYVKSLKTKTGNLT